MSSSIGVVIRDSQGFVMASLCLHIGACLQPQIAKAMAILRGLRLAMKTGLVPTSLESDAKGAFDIVFKMMFLKTIFKNKNHVL